MNFEARQNIKPLHVATKWGRANSVNLLLDSQAKIDVKTRDGLTPLHCAARSGHDQIVELLINRNAGSSFNISCKRTRLPECSASQMSRSGTPWR